MLTLLCFLLSVCIIPYGNAYEHITKYGNIANVRLMDTLYSNDYKFYNNTSGTGLIPELLGIADTDSVYGYNTYLRSLSAGQNLPEVVIAVLDSGINAGHKKFQQRVLYQYAQNYITGNSKDIRDTTGHGTHVAGIICDLTLENVKILPIRVFDEEEVTNPETIQRAVEYLINVKENNDLNIVAINMSLGTYPMDINSADYIPTLNWYQGIINRLLGSGILPFVANGNGKENANKIKVGSSNPSLPAACYGVVAVSAFDAHAYNNNPDNMALAQFSNYGSHTDISAPGTYSSSGLISAGANYDDTASLGGTSMATAFVTAAYALLCSNPINEEADWVNFLENQGSGWNDLTDKGIYHYLNPIHKALLWGAEDFNIRNNYGEVVENSIDSDGDGSKDRDPYFGHGCVNLRKFLDLELPPDFVPPDFETEPEIPEDKVFIKLNVIGGGSAMYANEVLPMQLYIKPSAEFEFELNLIASYGYKLTGLSVTKGNITKPLNIGGEYDYTSNFFYTFGENTFSGGQEYTVNAMFTQYDIPKESGKTVSDTKYDLSVLVWYILGFAVFVIIVYAIRATFFSKNTPPDPADDLTLPDDFPFPR